MALFLCFSPVCNAQATLPEFDGSVQLLMQAEIRYFSSARKHQLAGEWQPLHGPLRWNHQQYGHFDAAYIRYLLPGAKRLGPDAGFYLWRYSMSARIFLNGTLIGDGGSLGPLARNLHRPLLARLTHTLLRKDFNEVIVELRVVPGYGYLLPPALGNYKQLLPEYKRRYFNQITLSWIILGITLVIAFLGLSLWMFDRSNTSYLYFAIAAFSWTVYSLNPVLEDFPISTVLWEWILHTGIDVFSVMIVFFNHRYFMLKRRRTEWACLTYLFLASACYAVLAQDTFARSSTLVHLGAFACWLYSIGTTIWLAWRIRRTDALVFSITYSVIFVLGVHDALLNTGLNRSLWLNHFFALNLGAPLVLLSISGQLIWQLRRKNIFSEISLAGAKARLEESFRLRETLERENAANAERARIYRDLHDDVGAKLLDLVYLATDEDQADIAREAIQDIRSIASIPVENTALLSDWAAKTRTESMHRVHKHGLNLNWPITASSHRLSSRQNYHLTHIIRELISNSIKHASASYLEIRLSTGRQLNIEYTDDGRGLDEDVTGSGSGMVGIRRRIKELAGTVEWHNRQPSGIRVVLTLPAISGQQS